MAVAAHKMAAGPRKEGTLNTCFVRVVDARPRKTMTPQQGFCSNVCVCVCACLGVFVYVCILDVQPALQTGFSASALK